MALNQSMLFCFQHLFPLNFHSSGKRHDHQLRCQVAIFSCLMTSKTCPSPTVWKVGGNTRHDAQVKSIGKLQWTSAVVRKMNMKVHCTDYKKIMLGHFCIQLFLCLGQFSSWILRHPNILCLTWMLRDVYVVLLWPGLESSYFSNLLDTTSIRILRSQDLKKQNLSRTWNETNILLINDHGTRKNPLTCSKHTDYR